MRVPKLRKDGTPKRSGLCEGDRRVARTLQFKLQVVEEYRSLQQGKAEGRCAVHQSLRLPSGLGYTPV